MTQAVAEIVTDPIPAPSLSEAIANFATRTPARDIPSSARHILRLSLLDWFAVANAGKDQPVSRMVREMSAHEAGVAEAGVIGLPQRLPARAATLVNATTSHALDYDDTHFMYIGHPSVVILPAALAIAERTGANGGDVLDAALIGVESACRIGAWLGRRHYDHGFHQTASSGCFGAAMAAVRLIGLDGERARHALGIAATRASGLKSQFGTMGKPYNAGIAAANGVEAALLAAAGFVSRADGLECDQGFADTHAGENNNLDMVLDGLGQRFAFETVQHKFHACCHGVHAALEALIAAREAHRLAPDDIKAVTVMVHPSWLRVCNIAEPTTGLEAKFSYRLTAAMALASRDTSALSTFTDDVCGDVDLVRLRDRVCVVAADSMADTASTIRIERHSGDDIEAHHDLERPIPTATREAKVRAKAASLLGENRADALWQQIGAFEGAGYQIQWRVLFGT